MARRGLVRLDDGRTVFVKVGTNDNTRLWARREIRAYAFLQEHRYRSAPRLLAANRDETAFAIEALPPRDGWNWSAEWTRERLARTLEAMDNLLRLGDGSIPSELRQPLLTQDEDGWRRLAGSPQLARALSIKLEGAGAAIGALDAHVQRSAEFLLRSDDLVHLDVRTDNCAWHADRNEVRLVDWNWLHKGDRRIDLAATPTMVSCSGFDVLPEMGGRLDAGALHWMAGYWLERASHPCGLAARKCYGTCSFAPA